MEKSKLCFFPVSFLVLLGCVACPSPEKGNGTKLSTPTIALNAEKTGITWNAVEGAVSYSISVNDEEAETVNETSYDFELDAGDYELKVVANASNKKNNSDVAEFSYSTLYATIGSLTVTNGVITWSNFIGAGVEYTIDDGEPVAVQGNSITASQAGIYTVRALPGYDEAANKYYVEKAGVLNKRAVLVQQAQAEGILLEDGEEESNTDLQEKYVVKKYDNNQGWVDTQATVVLEENNPFSTGKCVKANIWHHGAWFKWTNELSCDGRIESVHFFVKGGPATRFALSFDITDDVMVGSINLKNVYATYMVQPAPQSWCEYTVSTDDANWSVNYNGQTYPFSQVQALLSGFGYQIQSIGDFFPFFGSYSIKAFGEYQDGGPTDAVYFDDIRLGVTPTSTVIDQKFEVTDGQYAFKSNLINAGVFTYAANGQSKVEFRQSNNLVTIPVTCTLDGPTQSMTITSVEAGLDFVANIKSTDAGKTFSLQSVSGTAAPYIQGMALDRCQTLFDFENFDSTGVGLDQSHTDPSAFSGLRKEFYSDYYSGGSGSAIGGDGWSMMGSSDYLNLSTEVAHTGAKSMRLEYNSSNQMRFLTYGLSQEGGSAYAKCSYLSMWVRANSTRTNKIKLKAFYINQVTPSTQSSMDEIEVDIAQDENHGWVEVRVELKASKNYYGFAILPMKNSGSSSGDGQYFYVDDICVYNTISPFYNQAA